jgi:hypothetical protein
MMKRCSLALAVAALALAPALGHAQDIPAASRPGLLQAGIALSSISPDLTNNRITGITGFVTFDFSERLGVEADIHLGSISTPNDIAVNSYLIGPRYVRRYGRYEPYAKVLFGIGSTVAQEQYIINEGTPGVPGTYGVLAAAGGLDIRLPYNLSVRAIDFEYQDWYSWKPHGLSPAIASVGIAYRFDSIFGK